MLVEQIWTDNPLRNFHYLVACAETREALAIDPFDHQLVLKRAEATQRRTQGFCMVALRLSILRDRL